MFDSGFNAIQPVHHSRVISAVGCLVTSVADLAGSAPTRALTEANCLREHLGWTVPTPKGAAVRHERLRLSRPIRAVLASLAAVALAGLLAVTAVIVGGDDRDAPQGRASGEAGAEPAETPNERAGREPVPEIALADFGGEPVRLTDFAGQPLVVNFFASWCPPCEAEMRDALGPVHDHPGDRVAFLGIALQDRPQAALEVVEQTGVSYPVARDPDGELFAALGLGGMPATVYVDAQGRVVHRHVGSLTRSQLEAQIAEHLAP